MRRSVVYTHLYIHIYIYRFPAKKVSTFIKVEPRAFLLLLKSLKLFFKKNEKRGRQRQQNNNNNMCVEKMTNDCLSKES